MVVVLKMTKMVILAVPHLIRGAVVVLEVVEGIKGGLSLGLRNGIEIVREAKEIVIETEIETETVKGNEKEIEIVKENVNENVKGIEKEKEIGNGKENENEKKQEKPKEKLCAKGKKRKKRRKGRRTREERGRRKRRTKNV